MATRDQIDDDIDIREREETREDVVTESTETRDPVNMAKIFAFLFGSLSVIVGAVALVRTGFDAPTSDTAVVFGLQMTAVLALAHVILGAIVLAGATSALAAKSTLSAVGAIFVIAGVIALVQEIPELGWTNANGVTYLIFGLGALLAGMLSSQGQVFSRRRVEEGTHLRR